VLNDILRSKRSGGAESGFVRTIETIARASWAQADAREMLRSYFRKRDEEDDAIFEQIATEAAESAADAAKP
jgi:hypothetical protein